MMEKKITRTVLMSRRSLLDGTLVLPEGVTYFVGKVPHGEFPHVPMDGGDCPGALLVKVSGGYEYEPWCTRRAGHPMPHVAHVRAGQPAAAWTDE